MCETYNLHVYIYQDNEQWILTADQIQVEKVCFIFI